MFFLYRGHCVSVYIYSASFQSIEMFFLSRSLNRVNIFSKYSIYRDVLSIDVTVSVHVNIFSQYSVCRDVLSIEDTVSVG